MDCSRASGDDAADVAKKGEGKGRAPAATSIGGGRKRVPISAAFRPAARQFNPFNGRLWYRQCDGRQSISPALSTPPPLPPDSGLIPAGTDGRACQMLLARHNSATVTDNTSPKICINIFFECVVPIRVFFCVFVCCIVGSRGHVRLSSRIGE